jgi:hypothetical protein
MSKENNFEQQIKTYREQLEALRIESIKAYDTAVMTLSGGALGIAFAFVADLASKGNIRSGCWFMASVASWSLSVGCVLFSHYMSYQAMEKAIDQVDDREVYVSEVGGWYDRATRWLNPIAGMLFVVGCFCMGWFLHKNVSN